MNKIALAAMSIILLFAKSAFADDIVRYQDGFTSDILERKADYIESTKEGLKEAGKISDKLMKVLKPRMPLPGLSAPQIGISKQVFLYSWDKRWENLVIVINPRIVSKDAGSKKAWELSQSSILKDGTVKIALIARPSEINVSYMDINGNPQAKVLKGFAARTFMHFYDNLQGVNYLKDKKTKVRTFPSYAEFEAFYKRQDKGKEHVIYFAPKTILHGANEEYNIHNRNS